jgi:hypothetical protein
MWKDMAPTAERLGRALLVLAGILTLGLLAANSASAGPVSTRIVSTPGQIVPIPAAIPHEEGDMVDSRLVPDLRWIAARFPIYITDGYSGPLPNGEWAGCHRCHVAHSDHYNGLAVDIVPLDGEPKCDASWAPITRLARWAEPTQNHPVAPFRWVGYDGDAGHGCGNHLHLSWEHAPAPQYELAEWVEVFPAGPAPERHKRHNRSKPAASGPSSGVKPSPRPTHRSSPPPAATPSGGFATSQSGGVSPHGD